MSYFEDVLKWHKLMEMPIGEDFPDTNELRNEVHTLGMRLVIEEFNELQRDWANGYIPGIADNTADLVWVLCGLMVRMGIDLDSVWKGVREANTAKLGGKRRDDGKLLKPEGWKPPDTLADVLLGRKLGDLKEKL